MKKVLAYSANGMPFKNGIPTSIVSYDFDISMKELIQKYDMEIWMPSKNAQNIPAHYKFFDLNKPIEEWDFSQFDEIIVTGASLNLFGNVLETSIVGFVRALKTFKGIGSFFLTDTTLTKFDIPSALQKRISSDSASKIICDINVHEHLTEDCFEAALKFENSIDKCYCTFYNTNNKLTSPYSEVLFVDLFRKQFLDRLRKENILFPPDHSELSHKACYIGNFKSNRVSRLKKMGIYNDELVEYYGKVAKGFKEASPVNVHDVNSYYRNHLAALVVVDSEMWQLGIPHRYLQSAILDVPTLMDVKIKDSIKYPIPVELSDFIFFDNYNQLKSKLEQLKDEKFYNKIVSIQNKFITQFFKEPAENISFTD